METQTKFQTLSREELRKLSTAELESYVSRLKADCKRIEAETLALRKQAEEDRQKTAEMMGELKVWQELNRKELKRLGWEDLTEEELAWIMRDDNYKKEWPMFHPSGARAIKERYAEKMKIPVDDTMDKKFAADPKMEVSSGWVDRSGNYYGVGIAEHDQWAWDYLTKQYGAQEAGIKIAAKGAAHEVLEASGWVRVMKWPGVDVKFVLPRSLSYDQKQTIDRYCSIYKIKLPYEEDFL